MKEIIEPYFINNAHPDFALIYKKLPHHMVMIGNFIDKAEAEYFIKAANAYESLKAQDSKQQAALKVARDGLIASKDTIQWEVIQQIDEALK